MCPWLSFAASALPVRRQVGAVLNRQQRDDLITVLFQVVQKLFLPALCVIQVRDLAAVLIGIALRGQAILADLRNNKG